MKIGIYPGTFDPVTNGHLDILTRASKLFDKIIVGVAVDSDKNTLFDINERVGFMKDAVKDIPNIEVESFSGLLMHFTESKGAKVIIRGLRAVSDFEYEFQLALMNKNLNDTVETIFLTTSSEYTFLSSTIIKSVVKLDGEINGLVPKKVEEALKAIYK
ncbi:MAG: pantetheine-phosphate adenylyltransferase [Firmicutes bacterium]|nr:pantetheine-phosphate adenylyltransferase [Bacillota bacterium]